MGSALFSLKQVANAYCFQRALRMVLSCVCQCSVFGLGYKDITNLYVTEAQIHFTFISILGHGSESSS